MFGGERRCIVSYRERPYCESEKMGRRPLVSGLSWAIGAFVRAAALTWPPRTRAHPNGRSVGLPCACQADVETGLPAAVTAVAHPIWRLVTW